MKNFEKEVLKTKTVSIWGIGYLGYTTLLKLQAKGFKAVIYDFSQKRLDKLLSKEYPSTSQINNWSKNGKIPLIDLNNVKIASNTDEMFENNIHLISFPESHETSYKELAQIFIKNNTKIDESLIIFQSAGVPKSINKNFTEILQEKNITTHISTLFRNDWIIEDFLFSDEKKIISANDTLSIKYTEVFLNHLNIDYVSLKNIEEAELYENAKTALNHTIIGFFNQLSLSYPHINVNELSKHLFKNINLTSLKLGVSNIDFRSEQSCENLLRGSNNEHLSILKDANNTNISFLYYYVDLMKRRNISSVTIFGLSSYNTLKDYRFSPSFLLAEYLNNENIKVYIHDEHTNAEEIKTLLPFCHYLDINTHIVSSDALVIMKLSPQYQYFTQTDIDMLNISKTPLIVDNTGYFKNFEYSQETIYHHFGDANLTKVLN